MEFINKLELQGIVGVCDVYEVGPDKCARFSVCTNNVYNAADGTPVIDTTWHNCTAWGSETPECKNLKKGDIVHLTGRLRRFTFTMADGAERVGYDVVVKTLEILPVE